MTKRSRTPNADGEWQCTSCQLWKPEWEYSKNKNMFNGLSPYCRTCASYNNHGYNKERQGKIKAMGEELQELRDRVTYLVSRNEALEEELRDYETFESDVTDYKGLIIQCECGDHLKPYTSFAFDEIESYWENPKLGSPTCVDCKRNILDQCDPEDRELYLEALEPHLDDPFTQLG